MSRGLRKLGAVFLLAVVAGGCAAGQAFRRGETAMRSGDLDGAVAYYRTAVQASPDNPDYKIALERAMLAASRAHLERAREFEEADQLDAARSEYQIAAEYDPSNRQAAAKVGALDQIIRERVEATRPRPQIDVLREQARQAAAAPALNPASQAPLTMSFNNQQLGQVLNFLGDATGINIQFDQQVNQMTPVTVRLDGVTFEEALQQVLTSNQLTYKVMNERSIIVFRDDVAGHNRYDDIYVQTFYISHADPTELTQILGNILRLPQGAQYMVQPNKNNNTILVRGSRAIVEIIGKLIEQNDKPRAEIVFDIEILEVNRNRAKQYGLNLTEYAIGGIFSPEVSPSSTTTTTPPANGQNGTGTTTTANTGRSTPPSGVASPPPFSANTIQGGFSTTDFYFAVPAAVVRFLASDTNTKTIAKPQLRGAEGTKLSLRLGESIPVIATTYTPLATGGAGVNPLSSYNYRDIGVNIDITPRVTVEGEILIDLQVENSSRSSDVSVAGVSVPSFGQRTVTTRMRLRDGESNLLAGLLREDERRSLRGFPGAMNLPVIKQLFSANESEITQTDIVMLLTPHIVRTHGITASDLQPIYIGTQGNLNLGGAPPLIAPPADAPPGAAAPAPGLRSPGVQLPSSPGVSVPPGSTPVPGTVPSPSPVLPQPSPAVPAPGAPAPGAGAPPPTPIPDDPPLAAPPPSPDAAAVAPAGPPVSQPADPAQITTGFGSAQVTLTPSGTTFRVGGGPYTVPILVNNASRLSTITLTLVYDPKLLRLRSVQEGAFMRTGGGNATFTQQTGPGRVDITIVRTGDVTGATGSGILAAALFDAIAPGSATLSINGSGTGPGGTPMGLQFRPVVVNIQ